MGVQEKIAAQIGSDAVVLYMKGQPQAPLCGFSANTVQILNACGVSDFTAIDVLADQEVREGIKVFSSWPTIPQLYIQGEFIGGNDIVRELYEQGELQKLLQSAKAG
jgi:monothiol glutaredoxin